MAAVNRILAAAALLAFVPSAALAQGTARSMDVDTSIRAAGMGVTSGGVTRGDPKAWDNVATLGRASGIGLPPGPWARFRYDHAARRGATGPSDVKRDGWPAWVDVVRIAIDLRGGQDETGGVR